jgi:hypothetical protein
MIGRSLKALMLVCLGAALALPMKSLADYIIVDGNGAFQTILSFVCQTSKICPGHVIIDSTGAEKATQTNPVRVGTNVLPATTVTSGTISVGATFQTALAASATRNGCIIQNHSDDILHVFFGATGSATNATSIDVGPWQQMGCQVGPGVVQDNIAVTTINTGDAYVIYSY